ncbi:winged helix-turn-helix domain-containing protein [Stenotrophomonas sp. Iso1]|uniref:winged helix-turn-helix domain-containing protein n=1 Tax=Stenotrophomonas sp. Iso1 TaxID=2977283 RepID=UPI0022B7894B|nr:winged helix-turn-helix domain-containing protein [Stenotrophomonas sp. Iso1]
MQTVDNSRPEADRLNIGACVVLLSSREVHGPGARNVQRLTPKSVGVLLVLARRAGQVVTRDELFADVWPDTMPTNDVLTQAVTQLRKVFAAADGGDDSAPYIETIAKTGYRLLAPVVWDETDLSGATPENSEIAAAARSDVPAAVATSTKSARELRRKLRRRVLLAVGLVLLASTVVMAWLLWGRASPNSPGDEVDASGTRVVGSPARPYRLITSNAAFETTPTLSPDGALVVFAKEAVGRSTLWIQSTGSTPPVALVTTPADASDRFPVWSPDGRQIAFARFMPHAGCEVLLVSATGGDARRATRCDGTDMLSFSWSADGRSLLFGSMTGAYASRGIRSLELASGRWSSLSYEMGADDFDYAPQYSPDGSRIGFVRNPQVGDLWMMDADGSNAERLTDDAAEIRGWSWLHSDEIVFGRRVDSESRLYRLDVATRTLRDMGVDDARNPAVSRHGGNLAFTRDRPQFGLFRIPLTEGGGERVRLFASSGRDAQPMVSPDGAQLAFTSDRSGTFALWWGRLAEPNSLRVVEGLRPEARQPMDWSSDSHSLLVNGRDADGLPGIYEVMPEDGRWKKLAVPVREPLQAIYGSVPGTLLVVERSNDDRMSLALFDRTQTPWKRMASLEGVSQVRLDRVGNRVLFTRLGSGGLWQAGPDLAADSILPVNKEVPTRWRYRTWAVAGSGMIGYMSIGAGCASQFSVIDGEGTGTGRCLDPSKFSSSNGMSLAPDGSAAFIALGVADGADIGVMRVPKRAPRRVLGVAKWLLWLEKPLS